ncbi:endo-1,4-beta-xylanase [Rhodopirellula bahusiensis]|uniref:Beta-xylanase n=1 Tax=Rhodopirellula bahusiensis TaxID=2014065 RepID=A0A2G1WAU1_9BACT|nr:endo-1,4-beta-xylanase [Rhodopirellula bahusiensis]PHQ36126.1 glycoside hydrolase [Rhodopirellula bahusiensis]
MTKSNSLSWLALLLLITPAGFAKSVSGDETNLPTKAPAGGERLVLAESTKPDRIGSYVADSLQHDIVTDQSASIGQTGLKNVETVAITVFDQPRNTWDASLSAKSDVAIAKGDQVLIGLWVRGESLSKEGTAIEGDGGVVEVVFEKRSDPYTKSIQYLVETKPNNEWKHVWIRCVCKDSYEAGECGVGLQIGYSPQRIEVAGLEVWKYPSETDIETLPMSPRSYTGRELDAAWRVEADQRIEKYRKCDMKLTIADADGNPMPNQVISIRQTKHAFRFGTAASVGMIGRTDDDAQKYREVLKELFNVVTVENGLKWEFWDNKTSQDHNQVLSAMDWCNEHDIAVRGHVLVWPAQKNSPKWITSLYDDPVALKQVVNTHIREMGFATHDRVADWDVLNETFDNREFEEHLGAECFSQFFQEADGVLPKADLYYNDYAGLVRAGVNTYHKDHFEMTIRRLIDEGAPIDGIGIQGHFGEILTPPHRLVRELDRWGQFDKKILITEFDVGISDQELMADFTRDFLTACFSHPDVDGIITWGFWAGAHWRPGSALYDKQWNLTAFGKAWVGLTNQKWMTDLKTELDRTGSVSSRVFKGDYQITVGDHTWDISATEDSEMTLTFPSAVEN